jgi:hypothetical protein
VRVRRALTHWTVCGLVAGKTRRRNGTDAGLAG